MFACRPPTPLSPEALGVSWSNFAQGGDLEIGAHLPHGRTDCALSCLASFLRPAFVKSGYVTARGCGPVLLRAVFYDMVAGQRYLSVSPWLGVLDYFPFLATAYRAPMDDGLSFGDHVRLASVGSRGRSTGSFSRNFQFPRWLYRFALPTKVNEMSSVVCVLPTLVSPKNKYLVFVPGAWHTAPKTLGVSRMVIVFLVRWRVAGEASRMGDGHQKDRGMILGSGSSAPPPTSGEGRGARD